MKKELVNIKSGKLITTEIMSSITIDCTIFGFKNGELEVLLIKHADGISKGKWGLPGGWIHEKESIDAEARRILQELTGLENIFLKQLKAFGAPDRFPLGRVITVGYYALVKREDYCVKAGFTAAEAKWVNIKNVSKLIYDHNEILDYSLENLKENIRQAPIGFSLLPEKFTLLELMQLYERILNKEMDKPNFRRKFLGMKFLVDLNEKQKDVSHRAAKLYKFDDEIYKKLTRRGFNFEF